MGSWFSSTKTEEKTVDANGAINNIIMEQNEKPIDVYSVELVALLGILVLLRSIEFFYFIYRNHQKKLKKYQNNSGSRA